jgi:hypothetical protein
MKIILLLLISFFLAPFFVESQNLDFIQYTVKNGLISNNVYDVKCDSKGYVWLATSKGVVRFNEQRSRVFTAQEGLKSNDYFKILVDSKDNVWLYSFNDICKIDNKLNIFSVADTKLFYRYFIKDSFDNIYFSILENLDSKKYRISNNKVEQITCKFDDSLFLYMPLGELTLIKNNKVVNYFFNKKTQKRYYQQILHGLDFLEDYSDNTDYSLLSVQNNKFIELNAEYHVFLSKFGYKLYKKGVPFTFEFWPNNAKRLTDNDILIDNGYLYVPLDNGINKFEIEGNALKFLEVFFSKSNSTGIIKDFEGNYWVSTLGNGLFKIQNQNSYKLNSSEINNYDENILQLGGYKKKLILSTSNNKLLKFDGNNFSLINKIGDVRKIIVDPQNFYLSSSSGFYFNNNVILPSASFKSFSTSNNKLGVISFKGITFTSSDLPQLEQSSSSLINVDIVGRFSAILLQNNIFYIGNQSGLYWGRISDKELFPVCLDNNKDGVSVNGIEESAEKDVWVSTEGDGVFLVKNKESVMHFKKELLDGNIHTMKVDEKGRIWLSTRKGVNCIKKLGSDYKVYTYTSFHGLPSDYVFDTYCYQDTLFVATDAGLVQMDVRVAENTNYNVAPKIYLNHVDLAYDGKNISIPVDSTITLQYDQNNLTFNYSGISYRSNGNITYQYRLLPQFKDWRTTTADNLNFNLIPGSYIFEVKAINAIGIQSERPAVYSFVIRPHFTETWWFRVLSIILITGMMTYILILLFNYRKRKFAEKNRTERQITELKLKSLQAQLNPHFIFNALNAIQQFINVENKRSANDYLSRFARLMRLYLVGSENQFITLEQELEILKLYTNLEHLRFSNIFTYTFEIDENIKLDQYIVPAMLLQPHVENAIRHGLTTSENKENRLTVTVCHCEGGICCVVEDNGIGRQQSIEQKQKGKTEHRSMGNKISKERIELIRSLKLGNIRETITDLFDENGSGSGTRVEIFIAGEEGNI